MSIRHEFLARVVIACTVMLVLPRALIAQNELRGLGGGTAADELPQAPKGKVHALCVGVRKYQGTGCPDLRFSRKDAEDLAAVFKAKYGYETKTLLDEQATKDAILREVDRYRSILTWDDSFIFYFAGHGQRVESRGGNAKDGLAAVICEGYFLPFSTGRYAPEKPDGATDHEKAIKLRDAMRASCIEYGEFVRSMNNFNARHVVLIFDACYSGMAALATRATPSDLSKTPDTLQLAEYYRGSRCVISAGDELQQVPEFSDRLLCFAELLTPPQKVARPIENGVFTYEFISSVRPAGVIRASDVYADVQKRVYTVLEKQNHPITRPLMNPFGKYSGQFLFIPSAESDWASRTEKKWAEEAAVRATSLAMRGDSDRQSKIESAANFWLAYRVTASMKPDDANYRKDPYWIDRFEKTVIQAQMGDPVASAAVFFMLAYGLGVNPDPYSAFMWAVKAAKAESEEGMIALCHALQEGIGGERNDSVAGALRQQVQAEETAAAAFMGMIQSASNDDAQGLGQSLAVFIQSYKKSKEKSFAKTMGMLYQNYDGVGRAMEESFRTGSSGDVTGWIDELTLRLDEVRGYVNHAKSPLYAKTEYAAYAILADKCCKRLSKKINDLRPLVGAGVGAGKQARAREQFRDIEADMAMLEALAPHIDIDGTFKRKK